MRSISCILLGLLSLLPFRMAFASESERDSLRVSLLTCEPGKETYELYGHTALRITDFREGEDWVFNYGVFNFKKPHFVWRFVLGQTDYELGVAPFSFFVAAYEKEGRGMIEQVLNFSPEEKRKLYEALVENYRPENREYRYNFLYDNCTTRAIQQIEYAVEGKVSFPVDSTGHSFRSIVHEFAGEGTWDCLGPDLVLGSETDVPIDVRQQMFSPLYARYYIKDAYIETDIGRQIPLVKEEHRILPSQLRAEKNFPLKPMYVFILLFLVAFLVSVKEIKIGRRLFAFDILVMLLQGCAGLVVAFLFFFSEHPAVGSNWLLLLLNPLPLLFIPVKVVQKVKGRQGYAYEYLLGAMLLTFGLTAVFGFQKYPVEIYILALMLLMRLVNTLHVGLKNKETVSYKRYAQ